MSLAFFFGISPFKATKRKIGTARFYLDESFVHFLFYLEAQQAIFY